MPWLLVALTAAAGFAFGNIVDKIMFNKAISNPFAFTFSSALTVFVISLLLPLFFEVHLSIVGFVAGLIYAITVFFYSVGLKWGEASRLMTVFYISPIFTLLLSFIFLSEHIGPIKIAGIVLTTIGAMSICYSPGGKQVRRQAVAAIVLSAFIFAIYSIFIRVLSTTVPEWSLVFSTITGFFVGSSVVLLFKDVRAALKGFFRNTHYFGIFLIGQSVCFIARICTILAISMYYVALASAVFATQPVFVLIFSVLASVILPQDFKEPLERNTLGLKFISIVLVVIGVTIISL